LSEYLSQVGICIISSFGRETFKHQRTTCHRTKVKANTGCTGTECRMHNEKPASPIRGNFNKFLFFIVLVYSTCKNAGAGNKAITCI
jgi:hypothetical protein